MLANMNTSKHVVMFANYVRERSEIDVRKHGMLANMKPELALEPRTSIECSEPVAIAIRGRRESIHQQANAEP